MVAFMPAVYELYYNQSLWEEAPAEALATRDNIYATFLSLPLFMIGAVFPLVIHFNFEEGLRVLSLAWICKKKAWSSIRSILHHFC